MWASTEGVPLKGISIMDMIAKYGVGFEKRSVFPLQLCTLECGG